MKILQAMMFMRMINKHIKCEMGEMMDYYTRYKEWQSDSTFDKATQEELRSISNNDKEIEDRFYRELEFGTGGLRGKLGAGTNRINIYTIRKATQGLAEYIIQEGEEAMKRGVAIAHDSRRFSQEFADEAARVLAANNISAYIFDGLRPTPVLSYAVRKLKAISGIVITASHNPPEYNGYKVYWEDGGQITSPKDKEIIAKVNGITDYKLIKTITRNEAIDNGFYHVISSVMDDDYIEELKKLVIDFEVIKQEADKLTIVYTPLHGTGNIPVRRILKEIGFNNVHVVPEQEIPDGNFPTVPYPNPEDIKAFELALSLAKKKNGDVIMATDPDADRLGVIVKTKDGEYKALTGNNIGILLMDYILRRKKELGILPENGAVISTIVSTYMSRNIAKNFNVKLFETLTGFKYIGEKIKEFKASGDHEFLFGFEESYGVLIGTHARDKDAIVAVMGVAELAAYYKAQNMTLYEALHMLYAKYGYFIESLQGITLKGKEGVLKIRHILTTLRENPPKEINGIKIISMRDYESGIIANFYTGETSTTKLPKSNVLYYDLEDGSWFCVRPSGTEPKVKIYFGVNADSEFDAKEKINDLEENVMALVNNIVA